MKEHCEICSNKVALIGFCKYCNKNYCLKHRLPEIHNCININVLIKKEFDNNSEKLLKDKIKKEIINF